MAPAASAPTMSSQSVTSSSSSSLSSSSCRLSRVLLLAGIVLVTIFLNGAHGESQESVPKVLAMGDQGPSDDSRLHPSPLVKRNVPAPASYAGHSIMRFGRAPHNIMHFGKRGGAATGSEQPLDSFFEQTQGEQSPESASSYEASSGAVSSIPDWLMASLLSKGSIVAHNGATRYILVPVGAGAAGVGAGAVGGVGGGSGGYFYPGLSKSKKAKLSEESDNVFMHFG